MIVEPFREHLAGLSDFAEELSEHSKVFGRDMSAKRVQFFMFFFQFANRLRLK